MLALRLYLIWATVAGLAVFSDICSSISKLLESGLILLIQYLIPKFRGFYFYLLSYRFQDLSCDLLRKKGEAKFFYAIFPHPRKKMGIIFLDMSSSSPG